MGRQRYLAVTVIPLVFLIAATFTAGYTKIFSSDPTLLFPPATRTVNSAVAGFFLIAVALIVGGCARQWYQILVKGKKPELHESPYVAVSDADAMAH
jgi:carbon starvation protein